ncbi:MAG: hypothetical protein WDA00_07545, partial [Eubacteriales bacterium]
GTAADPWLIENGAQLALMAQSVNGDTTSGTIYRKGFYKLTADIVLNAGAFAEDGTWSQEGTPHQWTPIGTDAKKFWGNFNGDGHTVSGLYINGDTAGFVGLFGYILSSDIYDFDIVNGYVRSTGNNVGIVIGAVRGSGSKQTNLTNITAAGFLYGGSSVGSIAGAVEFSDSTTLRTTLTDCVNYAPVTATGSTVGGIVGSTVTTRVLGCINYGAVSGDSFVGGIAGSFPSFAVATNRVETHYYNCINHGDVQGTGTAVGGIVGKADAKDHFRLTNCLNTGDVEGDNVVGGIIGSIAINATNRQANLYNNLVTGSVSATGTEQADVGMLVGASTSSGTTDINVKRNYYLLREGDVAQGPNTVGNAEENFALTPEQVAGTATESIGPGSQRADTPSVLVALNNWVLSTANVEYKSWHATDGIPTPHRLYETTYALSITGEENGQLTMLSAENSLFPLVFSQSLYNRDAVLTFTLAANEGYVVRQVSYAAAGTTTDLFPDSHGNYALVMPGAATTIQLALVPVGEGMHPIHYEACDGVTAWSSYKHPVHFVGYETLIPTPTKPGSIFQGWLVDDSEVPVMELILGEDDYTDDITLTATWERKADIALDNDIQNSVYNGEGIAYVLTGTDAALPDYIISYLVGGEWTTEAPVNAGTYSVKLERDESAAHQAYSVELTGALVIDKAAGVVSNVSDIGRTYDGTAVSNPTYEMVGDGEISIAYYKGETLLESAPVNGGIYTVKVILSEGNNYYGTETTATFTIAKASLAGLLSWDYESAFSYDFIEKTVSVLGLPADVTPVYTANKATAAGEYVAKVSFEYNEDNYEPISLTDLTWTINKASLAGLISWDYESAFTYDGTLKTVSVLGLPGDVTVNYTDNTATGAGSYTAKAAFEYNTSNYEPFTIDDLSWTIEKATFNMSGVAWDYTTPFTYSGSAYTVALTGLPEGVSANYTDATKTGAGSYTATVTFTYDTDNYNTISFASLLWTINKATAVITVAPETVLYHTGEPLSLEATLNHTETTLVYDGNGKTDVGIYTVTITAAATDNYTAASATATLVIKKSDETLLSEMEAAMTAGEAAELMSEILAALKTTNAAYLRLENKTAAAVGPLMSRFGALAGKYNRQAYDYNESMAAVLSTAATTIFALKAAPSIQAAVADIKSKLET